MKSFRYVSSVKLAQGESVRLTVNGLLVITNLMRNYEPSIYMINYGGPSYEHIAGRTFENIDVAFSFEGSELVITSTNSIGASLYYSYQSIAL